jgi:hypothetical protein
VRFLASGTRAAPLGRPAIDGSRAVFTISGRTLSRIVEIDLTNDIVQILRRSTRGLLLGPTLRGEELLYVQSTFRGQELRLGPRIGDGTTDRILWSRFPTARRDVGREPGKRRHAAGYPGRRAPRLPPRPPRGVTISWWTTAMNGTSAYVTSLRHRPGGVTEPSIWRVPL